MRDPTVEVQILEGAVSVMSGALDALIDACVAADGSLRTPDRSAIMRARSMLPPAFKNALNKNLPSNIQRMEAPGPR